MESGHSLERVPSNGRVLVAEPSGRHKLGGSARQYRRPLRSCDHIQAPGAQGITRKRRSAPMIT
jgi:hypothetical protein